MKYYVYILRSIVNNSYYKGSTSDFSRRLHEHNQQREKATARYAPWEVVWYCTKATRSEALRLEMKLKRITSRSKLERFIKKYSSLGGQDVARERKS